MLLRALLQDSVIYGGADFLTKLVAFLVFPLIAASLNPHSFGTLELILTTVNLLGLVMNCGLNNSTQRFYWDSETPEAKQPSLVSGGLFTQLALGLLLTVLVVVFLPTIEAFIASTTSDVTRITLFSALLLMIVIQVTQYLLDVTRLHFAPYKFLIFSSLSRVLTILGAAYAVIVLARGVEGFVIAQALIGLAIIPLGLWFVKRELTWRIDIALLKQQIIFGYPFIFAGMAYWLFGSMDRWMLANMASVEETGVYSVAFRFASVVLFVSAAFGQAWSPYSMKLRMNFPHHYRRIYAHILLILLFAMLVIGGGLALFAGEIIGWLMPTSYYAAGVPLAILAFGIILQATTQITAIGISLEKRTGILAQMAWITALINLLGNYLLIPYYGATGAAIATLFSYFILTAGYLFYSQKLHPLPIAWKPLLWLLVLGACVLAVAILCYSPHWHWPTALIKFACALVCIVLALPFLPLRQLRVIASDMLPKT